MLYAVSIIFKNSAIVQTFYFKAHKNAELVFNKSCSLDFKRLHIEDDFGSVGNYLIEDIAGSTFTDVDKDMDKQTEIALMNEKAQLRTADRINNDAGIRLLKQNIQPGNSKLLGLKNVN